MPDCNAEYEVLAGLLDELNALLALVDAKKDEVDAARAAYEKCLAATPPPSP